MYTPDKHICFRLGKVMRRVYNYYQQKLAPFDLTPTQFFVFNALWAENGIRLSDLAERVALDGATLTGVIDRIEKVGLVERKGDPEDRRSIRVFLTEKGKEIAPRVLKFADELDEALRQPFPQRDMQVFEQVLGALAETPPTLAPKKGIPKVVS